MSDYELLTLKQAIAFLGITKPSFYAAIAAGRLPQAVYPTPRAPRWIKGELIAALAKRRQSPAESNVARHRARMARLRAAPVQETDSAADLKTAGTQGPDLGDGGHFVTLSTTTTAPK